VELLLTVDARMEGADIVPLNVPVVYVCGEVRVWGERRAPSGGAPDGGAGSARTPKGSTGELASLTKVFEEIPFETREANGSMLLISLVPLGVFVIER
jgi:hypothetical protein